MSAESTPRIVVGVVEPPRRIPIRNALGHVLAELEVAGSLATFYVGGVEIRLTRSELLRFAAAFGVASERSR